MAHVTLEMCLMHDAYAWHAIFGAFGEDKQLVQVQWGRKHIP